MIERIFVDNFRCFVNFEWKPSQLALLLGENGSGKTSIAEVLWGLRALIAEGSEVRRWFPASSRTLWDKRLEQRFELDVRIEGAPYSYSLLLEHDPEDSKQTWVKQEALRQDTTVLLAYSDGKLDLYSDDGDWFRGLPTNRGRSGLGVVAPDNSFKKLLRFKQWFSEGIWYFRPDARAMESRTDLQTEWLEPNLRNFAAWYPSLIARDLEAAIRVKSSLAESIPGFDTLGVDKQGSHLQMRFKAGKSPGYAVDFRDISDGQRALSALYVLRHAVLQPGRLVIFDEPDNYVALREIQPWIMEIIDVALTTGGPQVWFVSHHPELLNSLAPNYGTRFFRHDDGPARVEPFKGVPGLTASEVVARGWTDE